MQVSIWYFTDERRPDKIGYYFGQRWIVMGNDEFGQYYWNGQKWFESKYASKDDTKACIVNFWTDIEFDEIYNSNGEPDVASQAALQDVIDAVERYKMIRALVK